MASSPPPSDQSRSPDPQPPVCARHTDRVSYVRCQRCSQPVCPECQRSAAVGVHCVTCVKNAAAQQPVARTALGAPATVDKPLATYVLIGLCLVVFVAQFLTPEVTNVAAFVPHYGLAEPWRVVTHGFAHSVGNPLHLGFNMYALYLAGSFLERGLGRWRFLWLYFAAMLTGAAFFSVIAGTTSTSGSMVYYSSAIGASGAVFGLFGALLVVQRKLGRDTSQLLVILGINAVLGFVIPGIAWEAHLGGFIAGALVAAAIVLLPKSVAGRVALIAVLASLTLLSLIAIFLVANPVTFSV